LAFKKKGSTDISCVVHTLTGPPPSSKASPAKIQLYRAVPDVIIEVRPGDLPSGNDPQLDKAIEVLKKEVKERGLKITPPVYRSERK